METVEGEGVGGLLVVVFPPRPPEKEMLAVGPIPFLGPVASDYSRIVVAKQPEVRRRYPDYFGG